MLSFDSMLCTLYEIQLFGEGYWNLKPIHIFGIVLGRERTCPTKWRIRMNNILFHYESYPGIGQTP